MNKKIKVGLYTRVSTQEQANDGYSIGEQKSRLEKYAEAHSWTVYKIYNDPGYSGGSTDRPGLTDLIRDVQNKKIDKVVVYKLDRLSRSQKDTLYLIEEIFKKNDVDFVSMTENFDTGTPLGIAMIGILSVFAQLEREQIKERMQVGLDARAKEGLYHGGPYVPIGYDKVDGRLVINDYEAMQIREIYKLFLDGTPVYSIYKYLVNKGYTHKYGSWTDASVRSCLSTKIYAGKIVWKNNVYDGQHEAIVDEDTFNKAQELINFRSSKFPDNPFKRTTLLGGLLWCGNCGARYYCKQNTLKKGVKKRDPNTTVQRYYTCYSRGKSSKKLIKNPNCKNKSWNVKDLDAIILGEIKKLAMDPDRMINEVKTSGSDRTRDIEIINKRLQEIDKQIAKLIDLYQIGTIDFNIINGKIEKLSDEKNNLTAELSNMDLVKPDLSVRDTKKILKTFTEVVDSADSEALTKVVHSLIDGIVLTGEDIEIHWKFS